MVSEGYWTYAVTYVGKESDGNLNAEQYNLAITLDDAVGAERIFYNVTGIKEGVVPTQFEAAPAGADATSGDVTFHPGDLADTYYFTVTATWHDGVIDLIQPMLAFPVSTTPILPVATSVSTALTVFTIMKPILSIRLKTMP